MTAVGINSRGPQETPSAAGKRGRTISLTLVDRHRGSNKGSATGGIWEAGLSSEWG